jgi:hypothetical protein
LNLHKKWIFVILAALIIASSGMAERILTTSNTVEEFTVYHENNTKRTFIDNPPAGPSVGDVYYFNATLHTGNETGPVVGEMWGIETVVRYEPSKIITSYENATGTTAQEQRLLYEGFSFLNKTDIDERDQIIVGSVWDNSNAQSPTMDINETVVKAILGGTGKYLGVRGQVVATHNADGGFTFVFTILR